MKNLKRISLAMLLALISSLTASAYDFEVDGIYYNYLSYNDFKVEVTSKNYIKNKDAGGGSYSGTVSIPISIIRNGVKYSVASIGEYAFYNCPNLTSVVIPPRVTSIGEYAFYDCSKLVSINIPSGVTSIGWCAFNGCSNLKSIDIPSSVTSIDAAAFYSCSGLTSVEIPSCITSIERSVFANCTNLTSVTIPNSVTIIGVDAFSYCTSLASVTIPNSVTSICRWAFDGCSRLTSVNISKSVKIIWDYAFQNCSSLTSIEIPNSVKSIHEYAFSDCSNLTSVVIGNSVDTIGIWAFDGCTKLRDVTALKAKPIKIDNTAFDYNTISSGTLRVPKGSAEAYSKAAVWKTFSKIVELKYDFEIDGIYYNKLADGKSVEVTYWASNLYSRAVYNIPSTVKYNGETYAVTSIGEYAFKYSDGLTSVEIPNSVTTIGGFAFSGCSNLTSVEIPNSVTSIGNSAFYGCSGLTSVVIPNSVTTIGESVFGGCSSLTSVVIPNSVRRIGSNAFSYCPKLLDVTSLNTTPPIIANNSFDSKTKTSGVLKVPDASVEAYSNADEWKTFSKIVGVSGGGETPEEPKQCAAPVISFAGGKIRVTCETEGAKCYYSVTSNDNNSGEGGEVNLTGKYTVTAYAAKEGWENSETVTETITLSTGQQGDMNGDGQITMSDANAIVNMYLGNK